MREELKERRIERGYSQAELGRLLGISRTGYLKIENGVTTNPSSSTRFALARALDVNPHTLKPRN